MPEPILLVVENDAATRAWLGEALERRFGADYQVLTEASPTSAVTRIEQECGRHADDGEGHLGSPRHGSPRGVAAAVADGATAARSAYDYLSRA